MSDEAQERESTLEDRIAYLSEMLQKARVKERRYNSCLLYTSDAADD